MGRHKTKYVVISQREGDVQNFTEYNSLAEAQQDVEAYLLDTDHRSFTDEIVLCQKLYAWRPATLSFNKTSYGCSSKIRLGDR